MLSDLFTAGGIVGLLGLSFGAILAVASRVFHVEIDPRVEKINSVLPGVNCGGCGLPGCIAYAEAIVTKDLDFTLCSPGGNACKLKIAEVLGKTAETTAHKTARIACASGGSHNTNFRYVYDGIQNCHAAAILSNGPNQCIWGCVYQNDCITVCKFDAIKLDEIGQRIIDHVKCCACGACVKVCPRNLIHIVPVKNKVHIHCNSKDKGAISRKYCGAAACCIGCGICQKNCQLGAIKIENNLAVIDYEICNNCGQCALKCPTKAIAIESIDIEISLINSEVEM
jgi:RnfABCDGE-type electron transport complex B subunit